MEVMLDKCVLILQHFLEVLIQTFQTQGLVLYFNRDLFYGGKIACYIYRKKNKNLQINK